MRPFRSTAYLRRFLPTTTLPPQTRPSPFLNLLARTTRRKPTQTTLPSKRPYSTPRNNNNNKNNKNPASDPTPHLHSPDASLSISQRFRKLSREYGWSAFGVYMLLSALDFPFCFAAVRYLGADRIGRYEHLVVEWVKTMIPEAAREAWRGRVASEGGAVAVGGAGGEETEVEGYGIGSDDQGVGVVGYDHGVREAEKRNESENASIWTQLALAYAIHKSFIFIRVPLTVAILPKVVKVLRGWGWDIGKRRPKGAK